MNVTYAKIKKKITEAFFQSALSSGLLKICRKILL